MGTCASPPRRAWRTGPGPWVAHGRPDYLPAGAQEPAEPGRRADRSLATAPDRSEGAARRAVRGRQALLEEGLIAHAGLSEVSVADIEAASKVFRSRRCRTATTSSTAAARTCSTTARSRASASSPGIRSPAANWRGAGAALDRIAEAPQRDAGPDRARLDAEGAR